MTRTLHGNILTSVCTADGLVLDSLPGIYTEDVYLNRLHQLRLMAKYVAKKPAKEQAEVVRAYHTKAAEALKKGELPEQFAERMDPKKFLTKSQIEDPMEVVLVKGTASKPGPQ